LHRTQLNKTGQRFVDCQFIATIFRADLNYEIFVEFGDSDS